MVGLLVGRVHRELRTFCAGGPERRVVQCLHCDSPLAGERLCLHHTLASKVKSAVTDRKQPHDPFN